MQCHLSLTMIWNNLKLLWGSFVYKKRVYHIISCDSKYAASYRTGNTIYSCQIGKRNFRNDEKRAMEEQLESTRKAYFPFAISRIKKSLFVFKCIEDERGWVAKLFHRNCDYLLVELCLYGRVVWADEDLLPTKFNHISPEKYWKTTLLPSNKHSLSEGLFKGCAKIISVKCTHWNSVDREITGRDRLLVYA